MSETLRTGEVYAMDQLAQQTQYLAEQTTLLRYYVGATFIIAVATCLALMQEQIRSALARASLSVTTDPLVSTPFGQGQQQLAHFPRLRVENVSRNPARDVELVLERIRRRDPATGSLFDVGSVFGLNLTWSHFPGRAIMPQIGGMTARSVDLGHVLRPSDRAIHRSSGDPAIEDLISVPPEETILKLAAVVDPFARSHLLGPGEWEIDLRLSGSNVSGRRVLITLHLTGQWYDDATRFAKEGLTYEAR
jgi:hypothetical protein